LIPTQMGKGSLTEEAQHHQGNPLAAAPPVAYFTVQSTCWTHVQVGRWHRDQENGSSARRYGMAAGGIFLASYAEADDAPGGVLIGIVVVVGAGALGVLGVQRIDGSRRSS
jgi:hypothetical protein